MRRSVFFFFVLISRLLAGLFDAPTPARAQSTSGKASDPAGIEYFEEHIRPVLVRECYECHSAKADEQQGGLQVDTAAALRRGGDHGPALQPGSPAASLLISALQHRDLEMPPQGKLPQQTIDRFAHWIELGAPDPRSTESAASSEIEQSDEPFWAFLPPTSPAVPVTENEVWPCTDIDRFVLHRLEDEGLEPVEDADRRALIRRATFDLWGLPPKPQAVEAFVHDRSTDAFARLVDRLLESPRFGERWGRHWLDVARYGESTGHERNFLYPHAWRYRDYVIEAFNEDKPYDEFLLEQVAGDQLTADEPAERDEQHIATGFLAIGPRNLLGSSDQFALDTADDQINVTTRAILGLTVSCARCHDHKFDPISTEEYYGLAGIFLSTDNLYGTQPGTGGGNNRHPSELIPLGPDGAKKHRAVVAHTQRIAEATKAYGKVQNELKKLRSLPEKQLAEKQEELAQVEREHDRAKAKLDDLKEQAPSPPSYAMGVRDADEIGGTKVRISGDAKNQGDLAPRGVLSCCTDAKQPPFANDASGRLALAEWLVDEQNPLTARVMVNRIWHHLMGRGLVSTVDNFGANGRRPSHPQLLDHLAVRFQKDDWSIKRMIRRIMLSHVYQLSAAHQAGNMEIDPGNVYLWRHSPQRLEAEAIRDAMLAVSGQLEYCPPPSGSVVARLGDGCLVRQIDADELKVDANYRSVYLPSARFFEPEVLQVFDGASANLVVGQRAETNVPGQALFLLNNDFVIEQARATARRILQEGDRDDEEKIKFAYRLALGRSPRESEIRRARQYLHQGVHFASETKQDMKIASVWAGLAQALFTSAEFRYVY